MSGMVILVKIICWILLPILTVSVYMAPSCWEIWYLETHLLGQFPFKSWLRGFLHVWEGRGRHNWRPN